MINRTKYAIILAMFFLLYSCGSSHVILSPQMCASSGVWSKDYTHVEEQELVKQRGMGFSITRRVWTPLGILKSKRIYLKDVLKKAQIECSDVYNIDYTVYGDWVDALRSFVPFMGSKTVNITGSIDPITKTREYKELIRDSKIIIYEE